MYKKSNEKVYYRIRAFSLNQKITKAKPASHGDGFSPLFQVNCASSNKDLPLILVCSDLNVIANFYKGTSSRSEEF
ncbi:unnamed protein product [Clavelina lepadiformis]|uniref:Uncharacterized protein n=1 Tax=Clavelina lepadiformis TaxID=159417 RepID=A0ABP0GD09_CLALP